MNTNAVLLFSFLFFHGCAFFLIWTAKRAVESFLAEHRQIGSYEAMEDFKDLARHNMGLALVLIPIAVVATLSSGALAFLNHGFAGVALAILGGGLLLVQATASHRLEKEAQQLPASEPFQEEYAAVTRSWKRKALPDF